MCKDDFNKKLYAGDFVELTASMETKNPWISRIWWNTIDGAFVDAQGSGTRELRYFLHDKYNIPIYNTDNTVAEIKISHTIKKVSYSDYIKWKK